MATKSSKFWIFPQGRVHRSACGIGMNKVVLLLFLVTSLGVAGCWQSTDMGDVPAQSYQNALSALETDNGNLFGQILFPSEFAQHSIRFSLDSLTFVTQPDGRFFIKRIPVGTHTLQVEIKGYESVYRSFDVAEDAQEKMRVFRLKEARGLVSGRLVKERGSMAEGIEVHLEPDGGVTLTNREGVFSFIGISAGKHVLKIRDPLYFTGNKHFNLISNEKRNLGTIKVFRQSRLNGKTASYQVPE